MGRLASWLAALTVPPYLGRVYLSRMHPKGFISPRATIHHSHLQLGAFIYIDDGVVIFRDNKGGPVELAEGVHLHRDTIIQTGQGGSIEIGKGTHIQPRCQLSAYKASIKIGSDVEIAPYCSFYPYDHGISAGEPIRSQPLQTKETGIVIDDGAWLGVGVIVLSGVRVGKGAVVGAGSVVTHDVPNDAVVAGVPARIVKMRWDLP